jgi:hypothetical protein
VASFQDDAGLNREAPGDGILAASQGEDEDEDEDEDESVITGRRRFNAIRPDGTPTQ